MPDHLADNLPNHLSNHLSDQDILLLLDHELPAARAASARQHLAACVECGARLASVRGTLDAAGDVFLRQAGPAAPSPLARGHLQRQLRQRSQPAWWRTLVPAWPFSAALTAALLAVAVGLAVHSHSTGSDRDDDTGSIPNLALTPGAIRPVTLPEICSAAGDDDDLDPAPPPAVQKAVFQEYGIAASGTQQNYQIDYLVNPQLGGTGDIRNLWPQAYRGGIWNARAKDQLEQRLHQMVCSRTIDLATAQHEIVTDWIGAYKKYVQQGAPRI